ncbi:alpha/beta fold hydrolase [Marinobacter sp.]|uniref:alpha/beta fold hydrolase n=1 Tax=Marinobacter sp. TaxID=50741 RepID=UPI003561EC8B
MNVQDRFVDVSGGELLVRSWTPARAEDRSPMVLFHDSLGSVKLWRDFPEALARRLERPVIAYDRLGFGQSSPREGLPSQRFIEEEAEIYFPALREALGFTKFLLFGHSVGGAMAIIIATRFAGDCELVITEASQAFVEEHTLDGIRAAKAQFQKPGQMDKLARYHGDKARWVLEAWTEVWLDPSFHHWNLEPFLPQVQCPVLALHGDHDEFGTLEFPRRIAEGVQGPSAQGILENCGHVPHREQQPKVLNTVAAFLTEHLAK